jgi:lipoprotein-releasing system permease protein
VFLRCINPLSALVERMTGFAVFPKGVYYLDAIPTQSDPLTVWITFAATIVLSVCAAVFPAVRAARLDPVEALRYE